MHKGKIVAGIDLGGTAINYTFVDAGEQFLIEGLCEHPALSKQGPDICLKQMTDGMGMAAAKAGISMQDIVAVGLDTPGPASADGVLSAKGSTNFVHKDWAGYDIRGGLEKRLGLPVRYLNDGNAAGRWGHFAYFGSCSGKTSITAVIGTGLGGGVLVNDQVVVGRKGYGGELGHVLIPYQDILLIEGLHPRCNCGRTGCLESCCSLGAIERDLLPYFLKRFPNHELAQLDPHEAAKKVRGLAEKGDEMCVDIFRVQAHALGLFFDEMVNTFDPDAFIVGGGALETNSDFQEWFIAKIRAGMPEQREEQDDIPLLVMPNGDTAGARGAAVEALQFAVSHNMFK